MTVECQYCKQPAELVTGNRIYPNRPEFAKLKFWRCTDCDARVGCHPGTRNPLGSLANGKLRKLRSRVHDDFDWIWKHGHMKQNEAYSWLASRLDITVKSCYIGKFNEKLCEKAIAILKEYKV